MFVACGIWCLADVSSVSPSSEQRVARLGGGRGGGGERGEKCPRPITLKLLMAME